MRVLAVAIDRFGNIPSTHAQTYNPNYSVCLKII
jgi:hypothetical protein